MRRGDGRRKEWFELQNVGSSEYTRSALTGCRVPTWIHPAKLLPVVVELRARLLVADVRLRKDSCHAAPLACPNAVAGKEGDLSIPQVRPPPKAPSRLLRNSPTKDFPL